MPRIIFKCPYIKGGADNAAHLQHYVRYIATRDGVDFVTDRNRSLPATAKQQELILQIIEDMPDAKSLFEYEDYEQQPTVANASAFITQALDQCLHEAGGRDNYVKYIAHRPRVEQLENHGLFTAAGESVVLSNVCNEVAAHTGNVWTPIISLRREDAARLSYDSARQWQALLRAQAAELARHMKIHPDNFRWYAAFHNESHHPHVHMVCWSIDPKEGYLTKQGIREIRSGLARQIFRQDLVQIYEQQTDRRGRLNTQSLDTLRELCRQMSSGICSNPNLEELLRKLSVQLGQTSGKKVYAFLRPELKVLVDEVVDTLAADERLAACYDAWYDMREEVLRTYHDTLPPRLPLSAQKEFKPIKNMVIREVMSMGAVFDELPSLDEATESSLPDDVDLPDGYDEVLPLDAAQTPSAKLHASWTDEYKQARTFLFGSKELEPDFGRALELFHQEVQGGNVLAMHDLGRMYADGLGVDSDGDTSHNWYAQALAGFLQIESGMGKKTRGAAYIRYRIGKMYMAGLGCEQDYAEAAVWLSRAAEQGHKYAQYSLAGLYYRGEGVEQDYSRAFELYAASAEQKNAYASYELAKMYRDGVGIRADSAKAQLHFQAAFHGFVAMELKGSDDKLQYRIGQMLRDGVGTPANEAEAVSYFERSAAVGNPHAEYALAKLYLKSGEREKIEKAMALLRKFADAENPAALYTLGKLYRDGVDGVLETDIPQAIECLTRAAELENEYAAFALGKLYLDVDTSYRDVPAAIRWLDVSADQGNQFAQYTLGRLYVLGEDVAKDMEAAVRFLTHSADQGNQFAQYALGKLHLMGQDIPQDREQALHWLTLSAAQGNEYAQFLIDHFDEIGRAREPDLFLAATNLMRQLGKIFEQQHRQMQGQSVRIDRKRLRILREKKLAQGHAYDDREQNLSDIGG